MPSCAGGTGCSKSSRTQHASKAHSSSTGTKYLYLGKESPSTPACDAATAAGAEGGSIGMRKNSRRAVHAPVDGREGERANVEGVARVVVQLDRVRRRALARRQHLPHRLLRLRGPRHTRAQLRMQSKYAGQPPSCAHAMHPASMHRHHVRPTRGKSGVPGKGGTLGCSGSSSMRRQNVADVA